MTKELLDCCKELLNASAACFRVINRQGGDAIADLELEFHLSGIKDGFGLRAQLLIDRAESELGSGVHAMPAPVAEPK